MSDVLANVYKRPWFISDDLDILIDPGQEYVVFNGYSKLTGSSRYNIAVLRNPTLDALLAAIVSGDLTARDGLSDLLQETNHPEWLWIAIRSVIPAL